MLARTGWVLNIVHDDDDSSLAYTSKLESNGNIGVNGKELSYKGDHSSKKKNIEYRYIRKIVTNNNNDIRLSKRSCE